MNAITDREAWADLDLPLGEPGSGLRRYAAAMHLRQRGLIGDAMLERYRICCRMDGEDPARASAPVAARRAAARSTCFGAMAEGDSTMGDSGAELYDGDHVAFLERLWGEGYLSPGGAEEVARVLEGLDLTGATVVDIGCGAGGITVSLARDHGAARVIGLDVEETVCAAARAKAEAAGVADRVEIRRVEPGPMPFADGSVDYVFSKDSIVHIADKHALARDVFRVLRSGGWFAASDWLIGHDGDPTPEMAAYIAAEDLDFQMASPARYEDALAEAGFANIRLVNRNPWYREQAKAELARLQGPERPDFEALLPEGDMEGQLATWRSMIRVLETGEHCPHHLRGRKP